LPLIGIGKNWKEKRLVKWDWDGGLLELQSTFSIQLAERQMRKEHIKRSEEQKIIGAFLFLE